MTVLITLTTAGASTGPFNLYSDVDTYATPFETGVSKSALVAGYNSTLVPNGSNVVYVLSTGTCNTGVYLSISGLVTTTTTSSSTTTTTTTTTSTPFSCLTGDRNAIATCSNGDAGQFTIAVGYKAAIIPGGFYYSGSGTRTYSAYIYDSTNSTILYSLTYTQTGSTPGTWTTFGSGNTLSAGTYYLHLNTVNCALNGSGTFSLQVGDCQPV
jgi:hypothetical protein